MYLESLMIRNYRKFGSENNITHFVNANNLGETKESEPSKLAQSSTLIIGKNNAGKTTITHALDLLVNQSPTSLKSSDFNMKYLRGLLSQYKKFFSPELEGDKEEEKPFEYPTLYFELSIKVINDENIFITNLAPFIPLDKESEQSIVIKVYYHLNEEEEFKEKVKEIISDQEGETAQLFALCDLLDEEETKYGCTFKNINDIEVKFDLAKLFSIEVIKANRHLDDLALTKAYQKIVKAIFQREDQDKTLDKDINTINQSIEKKPTLENTENSLQEVLKQIENTSSMGMKLLGNVTKEQVLSNLIRYVFTDHGDYIPENQFGLGYINLLNNIGHIVHYIDNYEGSSHKYRINMVFIEEPEVFMHPQMQEFFITRIDKGIAEILKINKAKEGGLDLFCQVVITTHSSHIVNSKIHSANSFNNINYITVEDKKAQVITLDDNILNEEVDGFTRKEDDKRKDLKFLKTHIKYKVSELFFADAVIFVEGITEENLLPFFIEGYSKLRDYHLSIFNINGAHQKLYLPLIEKLHIPCLIITDIDIKREDWEKNKKISKKEDEETSKKEGKETENTPCFAQVKNRLKGRKTTNTTLQSFFGKDDLPYDDYYEDENLYCVFQRKYIERQYATSLEEALILTNYDNTILHNALESTMEGIFENILGKDEEKDSKNLINSSFELQCKLGEGGRKSKFASNLLYELITSKENNFKIPQYIEDGFNWLSKKLASQEKGAK